MNLPFVGVNVGVEVVFWFCSAEPRTRGSSFKRSSMERSQSKVATWLMDTAGMDQCSKGGCGDRSSRQSLCDTHKKEPNTMKGCQGTTCFREEACERGRRLARPVLYPLCDVCGERTLGASASGAEFGALTSACCVVLQRTTRWD